MGNEHLTGRMVCATALFDDAMLNHAIVVFSSRVDSPHTANKAAHGAVPRGVPTTQLSQEAFLCPDSMLLHSADSSLLRRDGLLCPHLQPSNKLHSAS